MKKNLWILIGVMVLLTLPWLGLQDYHTKGEPREAIVAQTMISQGNWILPHNNGGEMAYKPPFLHWCMAAVSLLVGEVSEYTSRLPNAVACILMMIWSYIFYARRRNADTALLGALICFSSFEVFRAAYTSRVDMMLTFCMVGAMLALGKWADTPKRRPVPWLAILMMSLGTLTKGPVAAVLPCGVAGLYLLLRGENFFRAFFSLAATALASLILPALWYYAAYQQGGEEFLALVREENLDRFLGKMSYRSHENGLWYYFVMLPAGLLPWTLTLLPALFRKWNISAWKDCGKDIVCRIRNMDQVTLFSAVAALTIFVFYCIPSSKRGVYIMPMYPFLGYLIALYLQKAWKPLVIKRVMAVVLGLYAVAYIAVVPIILNKKSDLPTARIVESIVGDAHLTSYVGGGAPKNPMHYFSINFYLKNRVGVWRENGPAEQKGYLLIGPKDMTEFQKKWTEYSFEPVEIPSHRSCDTRQPVLLYKYERK